MLPNAKKIPDLADFLGPDDEDDEDDGPQSPDQIWAIAQAWNAALGGLTEGADGQ